MTAGRWRRSSPARFADAEAYAAGGIDGLIVENHGDIPFLKPDRLGPETAACMAVIDRARARAPAACRSASTCWPMPRMPALAIAKAAGAAFIRVNQWANAYVANEGFIEGPAAEATRYRAAIAATRHPHLRRRPRQARRPRDHRRPLLAELTRDVEFFGADAAIATGQRTGDSATLDELQAIKAATALPVLVGSGVTAANVAGILAIADGVIVASWLKPDGVWWNAVDPPAAAFMAAAAPEPVRLLVLGNAAIDLSYRIQAPTPRRDPAGRGQQVEIGGKGLNQAVVAARAGASTRLVAAVGDDWAVP